jgi:hypothetical protein
MVAQTCDFFEDWFVARVDEWRDNHVSLIEEANKTKRKQYEEFLCERDIPKSKLMAELIKEARAYDRNFGDALNKEYNSYVDLMYKQNIPHARVSMLMDNVKLRDQIYNEIQLGHMFTTQAWKNATSTLIKEEFHILRPSCDRKEQLKRKRVEDQLDQVHGTAEQSKDDLESAMQNLQQEGDQLADRVAVLMKYDPIKSLSVSSLDTVTETSQLLSGLPACFLVWPDLREEKQQMQKTISRKWCSTLLNLEYGLLRDGIDCIINETSSLAERLLQATVVDEDRFFDRLRQATKVTDQMEYVGHVLHAMPRVREFLVAMNMQDSYEALLRDLERTRARLLEETSSVVRETEELFEKKIVTSCVQADVNDFFISKLKLARDAVVNDGNVSPRVVRTPGRPTPIFEYPGHTPIRLIYDWQISLHAILTADEPVELVRMEGLQERVTHEVLPSMETERHELRLRFVGRVDLKSDVPKSLASGESFLTRMSHLVNMATDALHRAMPTKSTSPGCLLSRCPYPVVLDEFFPNRLSKESIHQLCNKCWCISSERDPEAARHQGWQTAWGELQNLKPLNQKPEYYWGLARTCVALSAWCDARDPRRRNKRQPKSLYMQNERERKAKITKRDNADPHGDSRFPSVL